MIKINFKISLTCLLLFIALTGKDASAQGKPKTGSVAGKSVSDKKGISNTTTVTMSAGDMVSVANGGHSFSSNPVSPGSVTDYKDSEVLQKIAEEEMTDKIFGKKTSYEYGITYWSGPVKEKYDYFISPFVADFISLNEEIYESQYYRNKIAAAIGKQLALAAENSGTFVSPGSRGRLIAETFNEFKNDIFDEDNVDAEYFRDRLSAIFKRVASGFSWKGDDFMDSAMMLQSFWARSNCVIAVIIAKSSINTEKIKSDLTTQLDYAKWGTLYKPLTGYLNQKSDFGVYALKVSAIQQKNGGFMSNLYDDRCNCPAQQLYNIGSAFRINSGSVFNNK